MSLNPNFKGTGGHPIKLKPRQISTSNYMLLEKLTGLTRKSLYAAMNRYSLDPSNYDDVSAYILIYTEKRHGKEFRKQKLKDVVF